jgi:glucose-6-phosphate 1-epimerase
MANFIHLDGYAHLVALPCIRFSFADYSAVVSLYGGQVLSLKKAGEELLWLSPTTNWQQQQPIRGGVPICWPWFGPASPELTKTAVPNHGLARTALWQQVADESCSDHALLILQAEFDNIPWHNGKVRLQCQYLLSDKGLHLHLHCSDLTMQQAALHSYFACDDVRRATVTPLPATFINKVAAAQTASALNFGEETDRIYPGAAATLTLQTPATLRLQQAGHDASVVWNPGQVKGSAAHDIGTEQWAKFVCVETARLALNDNTALNLQMTVGRVS